MKVFISWSGRRSRETATLLRSWLPQVLNEVQPWVSDDDLNVGGNWSGEIIKQLNDAQFGVICVTPGNKRREWLNFEAGAISKSVGDEVTRVAPFLIGFNSKSELTGPLSRFQSIQPHKVEMLKLLLSLNSALLAPRPVSAVDEALDVWWPKFQIPYEAIEQSVNGQPPSRRSDSDKLDEILGMVRAIARDSSVVATTSVEGLRRAARNRQAHNLATARPGAIDDALRDLRLNLPADLDVDHAGRYLFVREPEAGSLDEVSADRIKEVAAQLGLQVVLAADL